MSSLVDLDRLARAYQRARDALLNERVAAGHWVGELASSALSTATAVSALAAITLHARSSLPRDVEQPIHAGLDWMLARQAADGGWGDTELSRSNISTTMLVVAAFHLAQRAGLSGLVEQHAAPLAAACAYIEAQGGIAGLRRRYGRDKTFAVPILTNYALAGLVPWREVSSLPFEAACLPQSWYRFAQLPVVSYAIPALVAIGQAKFHHDPPGNPFVRLVRRASLGRSLHVLRSMQPASGGYLEAIPLTSFVVMSLASIGQGGHAVARDGVRFLLDSRRPDGSWPIDTNLATWVTTLSILALGHDPVPDWNTPELRAWVLSCQHRERHPFTGAAPGGWGWSDLSGAVPDADDTPGALLALETLALQAPAAEQAQIEQARRAGGTWLADLQNRDGGWPTFCRGWGQLPFDRSGSDLTAHALRALSGLGKVRDRGVSRGLAYLERMQRPDGSWLPLWFGNQHQPDDENPLYGTAKVLMAFRDLRLLDCPAVERGWAFLARQQNDDNGWGGGPPLERGVPRGACRSSVEETALVVEALWPARGREELQVVIRSGLNWLIESVERDVYRVPSPIGFYFAKLWYYEKLYPIIFIVSALGAAWADEARAAAGLSRPARVDGDG